MSTLLRPRAALAGRQQRNTLITLRFEQHLHDPAVSIYIDPVFPLTPSMKSRHGAPGETRQLCKRQAYCGGAFGDFVRINSMLFAHGSRTKSIFAYLMSRPNRFPLQKKILRFFPSL